MLFVSKPSPEKSLGIANSRDVLSTVNLIGACAWAMPIVKKPKKNRVGILAFKIISFEHALMVHGSAFSSVCGGSVLFNVSKSGCAGLSSGFSRATDKARIRILLLSGSVSVLSFAFTSIEYAKRYEY